MQTSTIFAPGSKTRPQMAASSSGPAPRGSAHTGHMDDRLRELPRRPDPGGTDEQLVDALSNREAYLPISCLEKVGLKRLKSPLSQR